MELSAVAYDIEAIEKGTWIEAPNAWIKQQIVEFPDVKFKVCGTSSKIIGEYIDSIETPKLPVSSKLVGEDLEKATFFAKTREAFYEVGLLDWSGFTSNEKEVPYSKEQAYEFMMTDKYEAVALSVIIAANEVSRLRDAKAEAVKKSSKKP